MRESGVMRRAVPPAAPYALQRLNNRTHRKLLVVDGEVGMIGGVGIAEEWTGDAQDPDHWRDTHVRVRGPVVRGLQGAFAENWLEATGDVLVGDDYLPDLEALEDGGPMQVVRSRAGVGDTNVEALYFLAIACAREHARPHRRVLRPAPGVRRRAVRRGGARRADARPRARPAHRQGVRAHRRPRSSTTGCSDGGVEVYEYGPTMLHAKTLCIDGVWSLVGSVNFDNRSFSSTTRRRCACSPRRRAQLTEAFERDLGSPSGWTRAAGGAGRCASARPSGATKLVRREL